MLKKISEFLEKSYSWIALITMFLSFVVGVMFLLSFVIGGQSGEMLATLAGDMMKWGIRLATIAILIGIVYMYTNNKHSLTLDSEKIKSS